MKILTGFAAVIVLVLLPLVIYQPSLDGGFLWDDDAHVSQNDVIQNPDGLAAIWFEPGAVPQYYPVAHTGFWLQYQLWGDWSMGYRLVNAVLHGLSALLVWLILRKLRVPGAWVIAAIFTVHPLHVESVAWISELKNVLSGFFYLLALYTWLFFAGPLNAPAPSQRKWWLYALCVLFFVAALLSKTVTATLPAVMLLLLWWQRPRMKWCDVIPVAPLFILGLMLGMVTILYEKHFVGAQGTDFDFSPIDRCLIAGRALWFYATKLLWPHPLIFFYPRWSIDPTSLVQYLYPLGVFAAMGLLFAFRGKLGKGPLVAVLFFAGTLMPALGFFDVYPFVFSFVANHFAYLASLGVIALVVGSLATLAHRLGKAGQWGGGVLAAVVIAVLCGMTWHESRVYQNSETLYLDVIAKNPRAWMAQNNLANLYIKQDRWAEAEKYVTQSLQVNPDNDRARKTLAVVYTHQGLRVKAIEQYIRSLEKQDKDPTTHVSLARLLIEDGQVDQAVKLLDRAIRIDPESAKAYIVLGNALLAKGEPQEALSYFRKAQSIDSADAEVPSGMALVSVALGRPVVAIRQYQDALKLNNNLPEIHNNLANLLAQQGKLSNALNHYRQAVEQNPTFLVARQNLAKTLTHMGKSQEAAAEYAQVLKAEPGNIEALTATADAHVVASELSLAKAGYEKVLKLDPLNAYAHNNLGVVYMMLNQDAQAARHVETALKISPEFTDAWFNLGLLNLKHNRQGPAAASFTQVLKLDPANGGASFQLGWIHELQNQEPQAVAMYRQAMVHMPKSSQVKERLAWILATTTRRELRAPQEAVTLATEAVKLSKRQDIGAMDTLGVAQASAGLYTEALQNGRRAAKLATEAGQEERAQLIQQRITLYKAQQPYVPLPGGPASQPPQAPKPEAVVKPPAIPAAKPTNQPVPTPSTQPAPTPAAAP